MNNLPDEIKLEIVKKTKTSREARNLCATSQEWRRVCDDWQARPYTLSFGEAASALNKSYEMGVLHKEIRSDHFVQYLMALQRGIEDATREQLLSLEHVWSEIKEVLPEEFIDELIGKAISKMKICDTDALEVIYPELLSDHRFIVRLPHISFVGDLLEHDCVFQNSAGGRRLRGLYWKLLLFGAQFKLRWDFLKGEGELFVRYGATDDPDEQLSRIYPEFKKYGNLAGVWGFEAKFWMADPGILLLYVNTPETLKVKDIATIEFNRSSVNIKFRGDTNVTRFSPACLFI